MTSNQATYAALLALDGASSHRSHPLTNSQVLHPGLVTRSDAPNEQRGLHLLADTRGTGPRGPHPGDVLYWVACLGGACLLLLCATT
jgi:hypothetical protein